MWTSSLFNQFPLGGCLYCVQSLLVLLALQQQQQALCVHESVLWGQILTYPSRRESQLVVEGGSGGSVVKSPPATAV